MPLGATSTTLMSGRNVAPSEFMTPSRKPWLRPSVAPGFMAAAQGLTLVLFSAQLKRFLWDRGCIQGFFEMC